MKINRPNTSITGRGDAITYIGISVLFIIINLVTLHNLMPWVDEVMFLDTSYNAAMHGHWETTAWYRVMGEYPFSTYPPLYQMVSAVWIRLFGGSLIAVRSLNILITFLLGGVCLRLIKRHAQPITPWAIVVFAILLWCTSEMAWMYRNGRPDLLGALLSVMTTESIIAFFNTGSRKTRATVVALSALIVCSGFQTAVYLGAIWLFLLIILRGRRREVWRLLPYLLTGIIIGIAVMALFMAAHGRLMAFGSSVIQFSATLSSIIVAILPLLGQWLGFDPLPYTQKLVELSTESSLADRFLSLLQFRSFLILFFITLLAYIVEYRRRLRQLASDKGFLLLLFAAYVPIVMTLAGRFAEYYRWMAFLPLLASIVLLTTRSRLWCGVLILTAVVISWFGIKSMLPDDNCRYDNIRQFVERQSFKKSDAVVCPFMTFYEMKPLCDTCYFVGIFPIEFIDHVDYIIESPDGDTFDRNISDYIDSLKHMQDIELIETDRTENPSLILYKIQPHD